MEDNSFNQQFLGSLLRYAKPILPALPEELIARKPIQAGPCPTKAKLLMFLAALPISFIAGVFAHLIGIVVAFLGYQLCRLLLAMLDNPGTIDGTFICWIVAIGIMVGYPFLVGALDHKLIAFLGKKACCRKQKTVAWASLLNGIPLYLGHVLMSFLMVNKIAIMTFSPVQLELVFTGQAKIVGENDLILYILCAIEFVILLLGSGLGGLEKKEEDTIFCQKHQTWYGDMVEGRYPASIIEGVEQRLTREVPLKQIEQVDFFTFPHLDFGYRCCSADEDCDVEVKTELWWLEKSINSQGESVDHIKNEIWFDAMFPADLAHAIIEELNLKPQDKKKKK